MDPLSPRAFPFLLSLIDASPASFTAYFPLEPHPEIDRRKGRPSPPLPGRRRWTAWNWIGGGGLALATHLPCWIPRHLRCRHISDRVRLIEQGLQHSHHLEEEGAWHSFSQIGGKRRDNPIQSIRTRRIGLLPFFLSSRPTAHNAGLDTPPLCPTVIQHRHTQQTKPTTHHRPIDRPTDWPNQLTNTPIPQPNPTRTDGTSLRRGLRPRPLRGRRLRLPCPLHAPHPLQDERGGGPGGAPGPCQGAFFCVVCGGWMDGVGVGSGDGVGLVLEHRLHRREPPASGVRVARGDIDQ